MIREITELSKIGHFTQGSIINQLNFKGKNTQHAIVISARCDLAQDKISTVICLPVWKFSDWLTEVANQEIFRKSQHQVTETLKNRLKQYKLTPEVITIYPESEVEKVLKQKIKNEEELNLINLYKDFLIKKDISAKLKETKGPKKEITSDLLANKKLDSHFIEHIDPNKPAEGYVVDFSNPFCLPIELVKEISKGIRIQNLTTKFNNSHQYFSGPPEAIVSCERRIISPYIELITQRFSNFFCRIGTENMPEHISKKFKEFFND